MQFGSYLILECHVLLSFDFRLGLKVSDGPIFSNFGSAFVLLRKRIRFATLRVLCFLGFLVLLITATGYLEARIEKN